jgi:hypothetical protein
MIDVESKGLEAIFSPTLWEEKRAIVRAKEKMAGPERAVHLNLASGGKFRPVSRFIQNIVRAFITKSTYYPK